MEQLNEALARLIEQASTGIDTSVGFLQAELPDVVQQLLVWYSLKSALGFAIGCSILFIGLPFILRKLKAMAEKERASMGYAVFTYAFGSIGVFSAGLTGAIVVTTNIDWLQIWIAPKIWLLEYAAGLVK